MSQLMRFPHKELLIATNNKNKVLELTSLFGRLFEGGIKLLTPKDFNLESPPEDTDTFEGNSLLKANYYFEKTSLPTLSDDTGVEIHEIKGMPGPFTADWALGATDFTVAFARVREELAKVGSTTAKPTATAVTVLSYKFNEANPIIFRGEVEGIIDFSYETKDMNRGFGFQPIMIPKPYDKPFSMLNEQQLYKISHRARAFRKFARFIR